MTTRLKTKPEANGEPAEAGSQPKAEKLVITPPRIRSIKFLLTGTVPLVQNKFSEKARQMIQDTQEAGSVSRKGKQRKPKDFEENYRNAMHVSVEGWQGVHCAGFRKAMIDACSLVGFHMTKAKKVLRVAPDGHSADGTPLVRITKGEPRMVIHPARNDNGSVDLRARPMWDAGWQCVLTVEYDADLFTATDVANLVTRVGSQCGVGEGRPNSKDSAGCDWGLFKVEDGPQPE